MVRDPMRPDPVLVVTNPRAGGGRATKRAGRFTAALRAAGVPFTERRTERPGDATALAATAAGVVVAIGGDGTVHEIVNGLRARDGLIGPLAVLAAGSGNDFAANVGMPDDPHELVARLQRHVLRTVDCGRADIDCEHGALQRRFVNDAGLGFEADVVLAAAGARWLRGMPLYLAATLRAVRRQRVVPCDLTYATDGGSVREALPILFASACNGPRVGGGLHFAPDASLGDGLVDVLRVTAPSRFATLALLLRLVRRRHRGDRRVRLERCREVAMEPAEPLPVTLDGEVVARRATRLVSRIGTEKLVLIG